MIMAKSETVKPSKENRWESWKFLRGKFEKIQFKRLKILKIDSTLPGNPIQVIKNPIGNLRSIGNCRYKTRE